MEIKKELEQILSGSEHSEIKANNDSLVTEEEKEKVISAVLSAYVSESVDFSGLSEEEKKVKQAKLEKGTKLLAASLGVVNVSQTMVASQIIGVNDLLNRLLVQMSETGLNAKQSQYYINAIVKLANVSIQQHNTLHKLQGNCQQKVVVEHLHVGDGGSAIVGQVNANGGRGPDEKPK